MNPAFRNEKGFSLIELAILLCIVSLLVGAILADYRRNQQNAMEQDIGAKQFVISNALTQFLTIWGRLPCPADGSVAPNNPAAGYEVCPASFGASPPVLMCTGKVCRIAGAQDNGVDGPIVNGNPTGDGLPDPVLTGSIPYAALGLTAKDGLDWWGNKIDYSVTEYLTNNDSKKALNSSAHDCPYCVYNDKIASITIKLLVLNPDHTELGIFPSGAALPVIFLSHGADGNGAYNYNGQQVVPCGAGRDAENCNGDAIFLGTGPGLYNPVPGATHYDDAFTVYKIRNDSDKWMTEPGSSMENKTGGRVGINNASPSATVDVGGNIRASGDSWAMNYCDDSSTNCFTPNMIAGPIVDGNPTASSLHCGTSTNPEFMQGIDGAQALKTACINTTNLVATQCPPGQYGVGTDLLGAVKCVTP